MAHNGVKQGAATRQATALAEEARWRCGAVRPMGLRQVCADRVREAQPATSEALQAIVSGVDAAQAPRGIAQRP